MTAAKSKAFFSVMTAAHQHGLLYSRNLQVRTSMLCRPDLVWARGSQSCYAAQNRRCDLCRSSPLVSAPD